jgi:hypothetical protein
LEETLEQKVERLECYIDLLRDFAVDQHTFLLNNWFISQRLAPEQIRKIQKALFTFNRKIKLAEQNGEEIPSFGQFCNEIIPLMKPCPNPVNKDVVMQMLRCACNLGYPYLKKYYLDQGTSLNEGD